MMSEQTQVNSANVEVPLQVMTKDPRKVTAGKGLAEWRCNKDKLAQAAKTRENEPKLTSSQAYGIGTVVAVEVLGLLGYYIYQYRKGDTLKDADKVTPIRSVEVQMQKCANKFEME